MTYSLGAPGRALDYRDPPEHIECCPVIYGAVEQAHNTLARVLALLDAGDHHIPAGLRLLAQAREQIPSIDMERVCEP